MMSTREAYRRIALFQKPDHIPNYDTLPAPRTIHAWRSQGLPADVDPREYFDIEKVEIIRSIDVGPLPGVTGQYQSLEQYRPMVEPLGFHMAMDDAAAMVACKNGREYYINHDRWGGVKLRLKRRGPEDEMAESAYLHAHYPLEEVAEWEALRDQFQAKIPERYGDHLPGEQAWPRRVAKWRDHEQVLVLEAPGMVGPVVQILGFENYAEHLHENRWLLEELMDARTDLALAILDRALDEVDIDFLWFWEDMAYRNGPYIGPRDFEDLAVPRYRKIADWYRQRGGEIVAVDSDGDVRLLIPGWIKAGINHIWPLEPFAGMDVVALRAEYGQDFSMRGGIDKFVIAKGKEAIDRELDRVAPVVADGGYLPHLDHMVPDAPFENYCYYMERKRAVLGVR